MKIFNGRIEVVYKAKQKGGSRARKHHATVSAALSSVDGLDVDAEVR